MVDFTVKVVSENNDKRIPVAVAGQVMVDIQDLFRHVGEYIVSKELRLLGTVSSKLSERFTIYVDKSGGIVLESSSEGKDIEGYGNIVEDAVALTEMTLDALGSGTGSYWVEDRFKDAIYRNQIIIDVVALYRDVSEREGLALMYGSGNELKKFGKVDVQKMSSFIGRKGLSVNGVAVGIIENLSNMPKNPRYVLRTGDGTVKLSFSDVNVAKGTDPGPNVVAGKINYSEDGKIASVEDVYETSPLKTIEFHRIVSPVGDVSLKRSVRADVGFKNGKWILSNENLGIYSTGESWDSAVESFHDYFIFLWIEYKSRNDSALDGEEREIRDFLNQLVA